MQLVLNSYGTSIRKKDDLIQIKLKDKKFEFAPQKVSSLLITTGVMLSSDVVTLALNHNIDLIFLGVCRTSLVPSTLNSHGARGGSKNYLIENHVVRPPPLRGWRSGEYRVQNPVSRAFPTRFAA